MAINVSNFVAEPNLEERVNQAIERAKRAASGIIETREDLEISLRMVLSDHYQIPVTSSRLEMPIDDLVFEAHLIIERAKKAQETPADAIKENRDEAADYASSGWEDVKPPTISDEERQRLKEFMTTGKFTGV